MTKSPKPKSPIPKSPIPKSPTQSTLQQRRPMIMLALWSLVVVIVWLFILPELQNFEFISRHIDLMEQREVNPSAMYYTELEKLPLRSESVEHALLLWP